MADPFSPIVLAAEISDEQSSIVGRIANAATKGLGAAAVSGTLSIYNTLADYVGGDQVDVEDSLRKFDDTWGDYYQQNKQTIDLVGFIGASVIPGTLAVKGLKLAAAGNAVGAFSRVLGYAPSRQAFYLDKAIKALGASGGTVTKAVTDAKLAQMSWAVADNLLTSAAVELAVVATLNDSPIFEGNDFGDFAKNVAVGAVFGGVIGGTIDSILGRGVVRNVQRQVEANRRMFDVVTDNAKIGLSKSDEVLTFTENILKLPDDYFNTTVNYKWQGVARTQVLDTADAFKAAKTTAESKAFDTLALKFNELADGGETTGQAFFNFIRTTIGTARQKEKSADQITDIVQGYLQNLKKVQPLNEKSGTQLHPAQFFITKEPKSIDKLFSTVMGKDTGKQAFYLTTGDVSSIKFGSVQRLGFADAREAFDAGYDAVITELGRAAINPKSQVVKRTPDLALTNKFYLNLDNGIVSTEVMPLAADFVKRNSDVSWKKDALYIGARRFAQADSAAVDIALDPLETSARYMWARDVPDTFFGTQKKTKLIDWQDFALLDRAKTLRPDHLNAGTFEVSMPNGTKLKASDVVDFPGFVNELKLQALTEQLQQLQNAKIPSTTKIAANLNVTESWVEDAITGNFRMSKEMAQEHQSLATYYRPRTLEVEFDDTIKQAVYSGGMFGPNHYSTAVLGHHYTLATRLREQQNAFAATMGEYADMFLDANTTLSQRVSEQGAGAGTFTASNANPGAAAERFVQDTGKNVSLLSQKIRDEEILSVAPVVNSIRDNPEAAAELGVLTTALRRDARKYYLVRELDAAGDKVLRLVDREAVKLSELDTGDFLGDLDGAIDYVKQQGTKEFPIRGEYLVKNAEVADFIDSFKSLNKARQNKQQVLLNAMGISRRLDLDAVYIPPVDTKRYPYFAFVSAKTRLGDATDVAMITAKSDDQLRQLAEQVGDEYEVIFKNDTKKFFKAKGVYDYSMQLNESSVNSALQRRGILGDFYPETRAENVLEDWIRWNSNQSDHLVRSAVQVKNRQFISELNFLSEQFQEASTSTVRGFANLKNKIADPYQDYVKTMLNVSKQSEYPLLDSLNEFIDKGAYKLYTELDNLHQSVFSGKDKTEAIARANKYAEQYGLGTPYEISNSALFDLANERYPKNLIRIAFQKTNYWLATVGLRLDMANSIVNTLSTPIMLGTEFSSIKQLAKNDPKLLGALGELVEMNVPGKNFSTPSTTKLMFSAGKSWWGKDKAVLFKRYEDIGVIKNIPQLYHEVLDDLVYLPNRRFEKVGAALDAAVEKGAKITGNTFAENYTRFISAEMMRQYSQPLVDAGRLSIKEQNAFISSFVNRVQGNYIASQRPIIFQGTTGAAISLFQTYAFNVLQQLFRHVEAGDKKTLAIFAGLQGTLYGLNGLPLFDAINTHLIGNAAGNTEHQDAYSVLPRANKELGDWMLYGTASAFPLFGDKSPALFSRGDMNPRHLTIIPVNPLDVPAVSASIKLADAVYTFGKQAANGADLSTSFLRALEHHGWSRPLAGFAQLLAGETTTSKGSLISAANDMETTSMLARIPARLVDFGGVTRIMGAKPMDEALALNSLYRMQAYKAHDKAKIEALGQVIKTKLGNNQMPDADEMEDFMATYAASGGRIETFSNSMQRWAKDSNSSIVNQLANNLKSPAGRKYQMILGGEELTDYNSPPQIIEGQE